MVNDAATVPPKLTDVAHDRLVPVIITVPLVESEVGVKPVMVGVPAVAVKLAALVPVLEGLVTEMVPVPPHGTTAVMLVLLTAVNDVAGMPPKLTADAQLKLVPVMVMVVPGAAVVGEKDVTVGAVTVYVKPARLAVP